MSKYKTFFDFYTHFLYKLTKIVLIKLKHDLSSSANDIKAKILTLKLETELDAISYDLHVALL